MDKKAALQLSINAIVVLILAITILGLGIGFIRNQFGGLTARFEDVEAEIQDQLITKIRESGDLLVFNRAELEVTQGKKDTFFIGVKNTDSNTQGDTVCYRMGVRCIRALQADNRCDLDRYTDDVIVGGQIGSRQTELSWFALFDEVDINNLDVGVYPVSVQIPKAKPDTYLMEFVVEKDKSNGICGGGGEFESFQSKQFFVVLR